MSVPSQPKECPPAEDWLVTYADAITLLMAFMVLLVSFSKVDQDKFDKTSSGLAENFSDAPTESTRNKMQEAMKDVVVTEGAEEVAKMATDATGSITLELDSAAFFRPASAELQPQAIPFLQGIYGELSSPLYRQFNINVEGHTDDDPISTMRYPSNWELSANRASTVVRFMLDATKADTRKDRNGQPYGFADNRMRATGFADTQPKVPNRDANGAPIRENQLANRRIVIRVNKSPVYEELKIPKFRRKAKDQSRRKSIN